MKFSELMINRIDLINSILVELNVSGLFKNPDFLVDEESMSQHRVTFAVYLENKKSVPLVIMLGENGIRLDICGLPETFEWSKKDIEDSKEEIIDFFKRLFTSYILIESCGSVYSKSRMYMFKENGEFIEKYILRGFIHSYSGWNCDKKLFFPIYPSR